MKRFKESELVVNPDGSIYHLKLHPAQLADTVLLVGDQGRVETISGLFDEVEHRVQNREFVTHTGRFRGKRISVLSTGIGTDNIDIVLNELDALVNIDLKERSLKNRHTSLDIIRLGTSGALQADIAVDSFVVTAYGLGFDGLIHYYKHADHLLREDMCEAFIKHTNWDKKLPRPYFVAGSAPLIDTIGKDLTQGITATATGFYGPQGRELRLPLAFLGLNEALESFAFEDQRVTNFEMETSALYALGRSLGHQTLTVCAIIANRAIKAYSKDHQSSVKKMIGLVLDRITQ